MSRISGRKSSSSSSDLFGRRAASPPRRPGKAAQPGAEALECRALLSAVAVLLQKGNVTVIDANVGDATLTVASAGPGTILISDANGVNVNGGPSQPTAVVPVSKDLSFVLVGIDTLSFDESAGPITVPGNLEINGGGRDTVQTINPSTANSLSVGKNLNITEWFDGGTVKLTDFQVGQDVSITNKGGTGATTNTTTLNVDPVKTANNSIGGSLTISNGKGTSTNSITDTNVARNLSVNNGSSTATTTVAYSGGTPFSPFVAGDLSVQGNGQNTVTIFGLSGALGIGRNLNVDLGDADGDSVAILSTVVANQTTIDDGNGDGDSVLISGSFLNGKTQIHQGNGTGDALTAFASNYDDNVEITQGDGDGSIDINASNFSKKTSIQTGKGNDNLNIGTTSTVIFDGEVQALLGNGNDTLRLGTGAVVKFKKNALFDGQKGTNTKLVGSVVTQPNASVTYKNFT